MKSILLMLVKPKSKTLGILGSILFSFLSFSWICEARWHFDISYRVRGSISKLKESVEPTKSTTEPTKPIEASSSIQNYFLNNTFYFKGEYYLNQIFDLSGGLRSSLSGVNERIKIWEYNQPVSDLYQIHAHLNWNLGIGKRLQVGRFVYDTRAPAMVSSNEYEPFIYLFDGLFFNYWTDPITLDIWLGRAPRLRGSTALNIKDGEKTETAYINNQDLRAQPIGSGVSLGLNFKNSVLKHAHMNLHYLYSKNIDNEKINLELVNDFKKSAEVRASLAIKGAFQHIHYFALFSGHGDEALDFKFQNRSTHVQLDYFKNNWFGSVFFGGYHKDSPGFRPWLYDRHSQAGWMDIFEWGNLKYAFIGYKVSVLDWFRLELQVLQFKAPKEGYVNLGYYGKNILPQKSETFIFKKGKLARELDVKLTRKVNDIVNVEWLTGFVLFDKAWRAQMDSYLRSQITTTIQF